MCYRYRGKDPATAFPLLERPSGGPPVDFYSRHYPLMYPAIRNGDTTTVLGIATSDSLTSPILLAPVYRLLVYRWALQILTALSVIDSHGIIHMDIAVQESFWLRQDLSLALVGFLGAKFVNTRGEHVPGRSHCGDEFRLGLFKDMAQQQPSANLDIFDWATMLHVFLTGKHPMNRRVQPTLSLAESAVTGALTVLEEEELDGIARKC